MTWSKPQCRSGKAAFRTQGLALKALDLIHRENLQAVAPLPYEPRSAYHCECGAWHLTSQTSGVSM